MKQKQKKKSSSSDLEKLGIDPDTDQKIDDFMKVFESDDLMKILIKLLKILILI